MVLFQLADVVSQAKARDDTDQKDDAESGQGFEGGVGDHEAPFAENMGKEGLDALQKQGASPATLGLYVAEIN